MTTTKKKRNKHNKTKKRFTEKHIPTIFDESLDPLYDEKSREKALSCYLANNEKVKKFAFKIFYFMLSYWKKFYPRKWKTIISHELLEQIGDNKIIEKIGFTSEERNQVFKFITSDNKKEFTEYLQDKFFKVTSVLNNLSKPDFVFYHVNVNKKLQNKFITNLDTLFLIKDFTWNDFVKIYDSSPKTHRKSYNFFIFNIIIYGSNDEQNMSLYKKNLIYFDFIKKSLPVDKKNNVNILKKIKLCNKSSISDPNYKEYSIYDARNFYEIDKQMPYAKIMDKFDEPYLSGPSGSTSILYISLFNFYDFNETKENKIMLLCVIIADYIPLWHTLAEILLSANIELHHYGVTNYQLKENPVIYVDKLIKPYILPNNVQK